jgi:nitrite reductase (NO-forming)
MGSIGIPAGPAADESGVLAGSGAGGRGDRRAFLRRAAGAGLAVPALGALGARFAAAQDAQPAAPTPPPGYVGSDAGTAGGTGETVPVPAEVQPFAVYDPVLPPVQAGAKGFIVGCRDTTVFVAPSVPYAGWTFDGTIPGRTLRVVEGDTVTLTVRNESAMTHSLDTHAAKTPPEINYRNLQPGEEFTWSFVAKVPGAYMYHCGTPPALMHIGAGMYGAMIVDPKEGWPPAQELVFVQSEIYVAEGADGVKVPDFEKLMGYGAMDYVVFNGHANQYVDHPIPIKVGQPVRIFLVNAGPNVWSSFHVVGAIFDRACINANPRNELFGLQGISVGPGDGACVEFTVEEPGKYVAVNHSFGHAAHGAIAILDAT